MNLDQFATQATRELLDVTGSNVAGRRLALRRQVRRRTFGRVGVLVTAALLVMAGTLAGVRSSSRDAQPAGPGAPARNGALVTVDERGSVVVLDGELPSTAPRRALAYSRVDFTSDGQQMMVQSRDGSLRLTDLSTGESTSLGDCPSPGCDADLSPSGDEVALVSQYGDRLIELRPVGEGPTEHLSTEGTDIRSPVWSPDGSHLAYVADEGLFVVRRDGGDARLLVPFGPEDALAVRPSWSPDGGRLAFARPEARRTGPEDPGAASYRFVLLVLDVESGVAGFTRDVGSCYCLGIAAPEAVWSPDGNLIAVNTVGNGLGDADSAARAAGVYLVAPDGSRWRRLTPRLVGFGMSWMPRVQ
jgi:dipeptidyl aminopeptidase/acylaminoacyl peptidase